ncbi:MAG: cyclopropane fatty acyl phospholipid synthase [Parachlamydiaceae bacterium]
MFLTEKSLGTFLSRAGIQVNGDRPDDMRIVDPRFYKQWFFEPSLAVGESYVEGWWECDRLDELFFKFCRYYPNESAYPLSRWFTKFKNTLLNMQTPMRSKKVAEKHYDLGNRLYAAMLGPSMAYTCGYWKNADTLDQAQLNKFDLICRKIQLKKGDKVLELGCGWGSFAKFAAENYECEVVAVNISKEQVRYAQQICAHLPVSVALCDYRDTHVYNPHQTMFDKVVSIGLCEHVGVKNYRSLMQIVKENMKDTGLFLLHTIGKNESSAYADPWINRYIFPNGVLPSVAYLSKAMENLFVIEDLHNFGADYDKTLMAWHHHFVYHWPELCLEYDARFYRMWTYYLLSCAGAFRARSIQLWQFVLSHNGLLGGYESVR